jgi:hypothetical protein
MRSLCERAPSVDAAETDGRDFEIAVSKLALLHHSAHRTGA